MNKIFLLLFLLPVFCFSQNEKIHYYIYATLNSENKTITAYEKVVYTNTTAQPVNFIWFRLYPNAYANDKTAYSNYLLKQRNLRFYFSDDEQKGYINQLNFQENNQPLKTEFDSTRNDVIKVFLQNPLQSGNSVEITTPFFVKIPYGFSNEFNFGYRNKDTIHLSHWYPEVAYQDEKGWDVTPFTSYATLKSNTANFDVKISTGTENDSTIVLNNSTDFVFAKPAAVRQYNENRGKGNFDILIPKFIKNKRPINQNLTQRFINQKINGIDSSSSRTLKPAFLFNLRETDKYNYLSFLPSIGYNNYDKVMVGVMIHNYQLPLNKFNFLLAPMYATNSKVFTGVGRLEYNVWHPDEWWRFSVSGERYSTNMSNFNLSDPLYTQMNRIVPAISYTKYYRETNPYKNWNFLLRAFFINQQQFATLPMDTTYIVKKQTENTTIVEFQTTLRDDRALYPYSATLRMDGGKNFLRIDFTGNYFLNYDASGRGLNTRLFAGKFFYLNSAARYGLTNTYMHPYFYSMSGTSGYSAESGNANGVGGTRPNDFTYSDYFIGRNESSGWMNQQIAQDGGFFKISTPVSYMPIGASDNWIAALNFTADLPAKIDPFRLLPFKLPVRVFLDVGTYSYAWQDDAPTGRFLYDAGFQVSILKEAVTVYFPILYSKAFRNAYKSQYPVKTFAHTISFSIDLGKLKPRVLNQLLPL